MHDIKQSFTRSLLSILLSGLCALSVFAQPMADRLAACLSDPLLKTTDVGISVYDLTANRTVYTYHDKHTFRPASTQKLVTTITALHALGNDYTLHTDLYTTGQLVGDTLRGSLRIVGGFDPLFSDTDLNRFIESIQQAGIHYVTDSIIADLSMVDIPYWGKGWAFDDAPWGYQPYLSPLLLNEGCVDVKVTPTVRDSLPIVSCHPASTFYAVKVKARSHAPELGPLHITRNWLDGGNTLLISGNAAKTKTERISMYKSENFFFHTFLTRLRELGIEGGIPYYTHTPAEAAGHRTLYSLQRPIKEVVHKALKESDNLCAEALFYHLAAHHKGQHGATTDEGIKAINLFVRTNLPEVSEAFRIADGCGLSHTNYLTPHLLVHFLHFAYHCLPIRTALDECLPIAGIDGTLHYRMRSLPTCRNVKAKTGSINGVSTLAGYVKARNGHVLAFAIMNSNVLQLRTARTFQDRICRILAS